jgi:hypothetical protein
MAKVNTISQFQNIDVYEVAFDAASVAAATVAEQAVAVTGVLASDYCLGVEPAASLGVSLSAYVSAADEIKVVFNNPTASPVDLASKTYRFIVARA